MGENNTSKIEINGYGLLENPSWDFEKFVKSKPIVDFLSPGGEINRLYFLGLERCYAVQELSGKWIDRELRNMLTKDKYVFYSDIPHKQ